MQAPEMAAYHILRSQCSLLNPSKLKLLSPSINPLIIFNRHNQNPNFSRQFRPIHSIFHKSSPQSPLLNTDQQSEENQSISSPEEPNLEQGRKAWSTYKTIPNGGWEGQGGETRVGGGEDLSSSNIWMSLGSSGVTGKSEENPSISSHDEPILEQPREVWSAFKANPSISSPDEQGAERRVGGGEGGEDLSSSNVSKRFGSRSVTGRGKKGKSKIVWVCSDCGYSAGQWWGTCKNCDKVGTLKQFSVSVNEGGGGKVNGYKASENMMQSWLPEERIGQGGPVRLADVTRGMNHNDWRIRLSGLFGLEVGRVLGGGVVPGSLILIGGDPGVGKSTLSLQIAAKIAESFDVGGAAPVVYISGEESVEQIGSRADRMSIDTEDLYLYSSTDIEDILEKVQPLSPRALVIDSIQTVYLTGVTGSPGGLIQVKECTSALLRFAKKTNVPVIVIGHVNKNGDIAGPRVLEHIVDVVLYMEGEKQSTHRLLRSVKNRFGSTDELGVFAMSETGLEAVLNPSEMFLSEEHPDADHLAGLAVAVIIDGSRTFLIEVQALCVSGSSGKHVNGVQTSRADMIISVLKKQAGIKLEDNSVFLNVISGLSLTETSGDLAVAVAICSSYLEFPIPNRMAFIGEIGLGGELRMVPRIEKRVHTLAKLGYKSCIVPKSAKKALTTLSSDIQVITCSNLKEVINKVFKK